MLGFFTSLFDSEMYENSDAPLNSRLDPLTTLIQITLCSMSNSRDPANEGSIHSKYKFHS